ncbi:hypothetical protein AOQ84DRAFT_377161 [Glonium stellatum]|uniref:Uncharacterized protein n=1 Tax=Glonium stellatum TaxID=574774 RepID=A0A8E2EZY8_9PEZI|nr:hypothetical protein AOQ84DRAFT_377161 [Glonium stellatum]
MQTSLVLDGLCSTGRNQSAARPPLYGAVLGTTESADGRHSYSSGSMWHTHVHGPRRLANVGERDGSPARLRRLSALTGALPTSEAGPASITRHPTLGSTENDMAKDIPPGPGGVGWSHDVRPLRLTPPLPFALRFILVDLGSASPQVGNHAKLQLVESREGTVHEHSNGCRLAEYRGQQ